MQIWKIWKWRNENGLDDIEKPVQARSSLSELQRTCCAVGVVSELLLEIHQLQAMDLLE
jgi:hypothetical protein